MLFFLGLLPEQLGELVGGGVVHLFVHGHAHDGAQGVDGVLIVHSLAVDAHGNDAHLAADLGGGLDGRRVGFILLLGQTQQVQLGGQSQLLHLGKGRDAAHHVYVELAVLEALERPKTSSP